MCSGAILLYRIPRVVVGENATFLGAEQLLRDHCVEVIVVDDERCRDLMRRFVAVHPRPVERRHRRAVSRSARPRPVTIR